jgi:cation diffusion facilitator family transporter
MSASADSKKVVIAALAGNIAIATCKFGAAYLSHSTATLAEAVHSLADTGNQGLLLVGMRLAAAPVSDKFAFGRASERYFWPFVVALLLFSVGGAFAVFEGIDHVIHGSAPGSRIWSYAVLGVSLVMEAMSFRVAFKEFKVMAKGRPLREALFEARDPTIPLVLAEDAMAMVGLVLAFVAVGLSQLTGIAWFDPAGSVLIGVALCGVAVLLAKITHALLIGESATADDQGAALDLTESVEGVERVTQLLTLHLGPEEIILAMKLAFRPGMTVEEVEDLTNEIERRIRAKLPQMRKIFIEVDSRGDGRGLAVAKSRAGASARPTEAT